MANIDNVNLNAGNRFMGGYGNASVVPFRQALAANPAAADVVRPVIIPAGMEVSAIILANDDLDSNGTPTLVFGMGYAPVDSNEGSLAASAAYFAAAGQTQFQSANDGKWYAKFAPIKFEQDVYLTLTIGTASATFAAGSFGGVVLGDAKGVK